MTERDGAKTRAHLPMIMPERANRESSQFKIPFMIGIVGHRYLVPQEIPQIRAALHELFKRLRDDNPQVPFRLLCSMAAGADLLAAEVAAELGLDIIALLPYSRRLCREDLETDADRADFDRICDLSDVIELNLPSGTSIDDVAHVGMARDKQMQRAGSLIARYSGLLVAVWNGMDTDHRAGTARAVQFRRDGIMPTDELIVAPRDVVLSPQDDDLTFEIKCSRVSQPAPAGVTVIGFNNGEFKRGLEYPKQLCTTLANIAAFNRDAERFNKEINEQGKPLSQPSEAPVAKTLEYLDRLFTAADWLGRYHRRCFTTALKARYFLWGFMAFLLITFKKDSIGDLAIMAISGVMAVFVLGTLLAVWAHKREWHRKYLDYRSLAEALRVDFYWEVAGVRSEFEGDFAHESFLQKQDAELQWIRNAMRAVSLQLAIHPCGDFEEGFPFVYANWIGDDHPGDIGQLHYYRERLHKLTRTLHVSEQIDRVLLFIGLALASTFAVDVVLRTYQLYLLPNELRGNLLWALALVPVYAAIFEIYLNEKSDRALVRQYQYMYSLFSFAANALRVAKKTEGKLEILRSLGHACLAEHAQWILAHRDKRIQGMRW